MLKITDIQNVVLNGKKRTLFNVYKLEDNAWLFDYNAHITGHYKRAKTVATKHCLENGINMNIDGWQF